MDWGLLGNWLTNSKAIHIIISCHWHPHLCGTIKLKCSSRDDLCSMTFSKNPYYPRDLVWGQVTDFFFFFFLTTLTFWKTSPANRLVLSCLMWSKFLVGHVTSNLFLDVNFKNTNKPIQDPTHPASFLFQVNLGKCRADQKDRAGAVVRPGTSVRPRIGRTLGNRKM